PAQAAGRAAGSGKPARPGREALRRLPMLAGRCAMHRVFVPAVMAALLLTAGCASSDKTPKYVTNWSSLRTGMTKSEVRDLLGRPAYRGEYIGSEMGRSLPRDMPLSDKSGLKSDFQEVFGRPELWQYGRFN